MRANLQDYYILSKISLGDKMLIIFQSTNEIHYRRVLELTEVIGFIEQSTSDELKMLRIDGEGSSYSFDLSLRLGRPEINNFPEVIFFSDLEEVEISFRACAKQIQFREWSEKDIWLK